MNPNPLEELKVQLFNAAFCELDDSWNYTNIVSPFTRIYLITKEGKGYICPNNKMIELKFNHLYIIPSFTNCSYSCQNRLSQYYIHFTNYLPDGLNIFDILTIRNEVEATPLDHELFKRLLEINKNAELIQSDPNVYQRKNWISGQFKHNSDVDLLETNGILKQILSRFIDGSSTNKTSIPRFSRLKEVFKYISSNLGTEIRVDTLADLACYSNDHFTRQFKQTTGLLPTEYINLKRIERAQLLLLTTAKTQREISEQTGFSCQQYYSRVFKKHTGCSPARYRKSEGFA